MIQPISKFLIVSCALTFFLLATTSTTYGFSVSGISFEPEAAPGEHITHEMDVGLRESDEPQDILVDIYDWNQTLQGDNIIAKEGSKLASPYSAKSILKASSTSFHLDPGGSQKVVLEGDIPTDAKAGGRYAIVSVHTVPKPMNVNGSETKNPIRLAYAINVLVLIKISGDEIKTGEITSLIVNEPVSGEHQNVTMIFKNTGDYHYMVDAEAYLKDKDGKVLANASLPLDSSIFPTFSRLFQFFLTPETPLKPGSYNVSAKISLKDGTVLATKNAQFKIKS
jgi:hypothetical protein